MNQVLEIIRERHSSGSEPGRRKDPYKLALAIEGGGQRGIVSGGALTALEALNLRDCFDVVYGSSSGAYTGSFFAAGDMITGVRFFLDYSQRQFLSFMRVLRGGPIFDLDYVEQCLHSLTPLNYHKAIGAKPPLHVIATDAEHARPVVIKDFKNTYELDRALKASANFPSFRRPKPMLFRRKRFLDAAILDPFCLHSAINEKNTHIMLIFSAPIHHSHSAGILDKKLVAPYFAKINEHVAEMFLHHSEYSVNGLSHIWNHYDGTHIMAVAPGKKAKLPRPLTRNRKLLSSGFFAGAEAVLNNFAPDEHAKQLLLNSFRADLRI